MKNFLTAHTILTLMAVTFKVVWGTPLSDLKKLLYLLVLLILCILTALIYLHICI